MERKMDETKDDDLIIRNWIVRPAYWMRYIGPRLREVWNSLPYDLRDRISDDAVEMAERDWSDSIDAMGEDA
jgi:hypothetical protein